MTQNTPDTIAVLGIGRGAPNAFTATAAALQTLQTETIYCDVKPGRAAELAALAESSGIVARGIEQDARTLRLPKRSVVISHVDAPATTATLATTFDQAGFLAFLFGRTTDDRMFTIGATLPAGSDRQPAALLLTAIADATLPGGSEYLFGSRSRPQLRHAEPAFRRLIRDKVALALPDLAAHRAEPDLWMSVSGRAASPVVVVDHRNGVRANPAAMGWEAVTMPCVRTKPGDDVFVAEVHARGIAFHHVHRRLQDRCVVVNGVAVIDPRGLTPLAGRPYDQAMREAERLHGTASLVISDRDPVHISD